MEVVESATLPFCVSGARRQLRCKCLHPTPFGPVKEGGAFCDEELRLRNFSYQELAALMFDAPRLELWPVPEASRLWKSWQSIADHFVE